MKRERIIVDGKTVGYKRLSGGHDDGKLGPDGEAMTPVYSESYPERVIRWEPGPKETKKIKAELERKLAKVSFVASDFICRVDYYDQVRKQEAEGITLDIDATIAHYRELDDRPWVIADDRLARVRAHSREHWDRVWQASDAAIYS
jgi:hypothetical protein